MVQFSFDMKNDPINVFLCPQGSTTVSDMEEIVGVLPSELMRTAGKLFKCYWALLASRYVYSKC